MTVGAQASTPRLVMLETWPREKYYQHPTTFHSLLVSQYHNGDNMGLFFIHTIIRTYLHHSRSGGKLSE